MRSIYLVNICVDECRRVGIKIPKQMTKFKPRDTPQQLEATLFRAREEENRMRLRMTRFSLLHDAREFAAFDDWENARIYQHLVMSPNYHSDFYISDDE